MKIEKIDMKTEEEIVGIEYEPAKIEKKWQQYWLEKKTFRAIDFDPKPKYYVLDMFPYPSSDGLHVGHPEGYTATDLVCRYKRMKGFNVLHPMGWDAFGLPAEQHAIQTGTHPKVTTEKNIHRFREQIRSLGFSYDWDREISTADESYYRWTQWIFLKLFEKGLAYQSFEPVNWCPELGTVLANEEVIDGKSERGGYPVIRKPMRQWVLKITAYAERLLQDLDGLDWPNSILEMQKNWIGKSVGAEIEFGIEGMGQENFTVFTTRPDTIFGVSFCVLAPEHVLVEKILAEKNTAVGKITAEKYKNEIRKYREETQARSDLERTRGDKEKTGVFTGRNAIHPVTGKPIPIFVGDYVLISYGKGAVMGVPGHDKRDHEFAKKFSLPILAIREGAKKPIEEEVYEGEGQLIHSEFLNGLDEKEGIEKICSWLEEKKKGKKTVTYKLRDWLFSRQRYWGEPFPIAFDKEGKATVLQESDLPIRLPQLEDFRPAGDGTSPLSKALDWLHFTDGSGKEWVRETNTMPQWAGSCWYYLRYLDPKNEKRAWDLEKEKYWMPVDLYIGGAEHAVLHLLYARFWHKVLYDCGFVSTKEPFQKLVNQGMILGENGEKMSKSRGNVVNPDDVIQAWGADSLRLYEMFMGPLEATKPWQMNGISGCHRFLRRLWRAVISTKEPLSVEQSRATKENPEITKQLHKTIKKVGEDIEALRFNTAISSLMEFVNTLYQYELQFSKETAEILTLLISPFAPHLGEELWQRLGHTDSLAYVSWPEFEPTLVEEEKITLSIQVNGKLRATMEVTKNLDQEAVLSLARNLEKVKEHLKGKNIKKEIYVPSRIINFVC